MLSCCSQNCLQFFCVLLKLTSKYWFCDNSERSLTAARQLRKSLSSYNFFIFILFSLTELLFGTRNLDDFLLQIFNCTTWKFAWETMIWLSEIRYALGFPQLSVNQFETTPLATRTKSDFPANTS